MSDANENILKDNNILSDCYQFQTKTFSSIEHPFLLDLFNKNNFKSILDIGTGDGNWINKFASIIPNTQITAIDADPNLIEFAKKHSQNLIDFQNAMFNSDYSNKCYDCILARFSMEHSVSPTDFVKEAFKRLNPGGMFIVTEWFIDIHHNSNSLWSEWRKKENEIYQKMGSHPRLALSLPKIFKENGFYSIQSNYHTISPITVDIKSFYELTIVYSKMYNKTYPDVFTDDFTKQLISYCNYSNKINDDFYLITHTIGNKPLK